MKNPVVHFEIYADDAEALARFYTDLFDWSVEPVPGMDYRLIKTVDTDASGMPSRPGGINGGMLHRPAGHGGRAWINYVDVPSVDAAVARALALGATVTRPRMAVPGMGWFAMLIDPQGNPFAVWQQDAQAR